MGMRPSNDPYGGHVPLVDKLIGNAYQVVRAVARHLKEIIYVANNMSAIVLVAQNLQKANTVTIRTNTGNPGSTIEVPLPAGIKTDNLMGVSVMLIASNGNAYTGDNGEFYTWIRDGFLRLTLSSSAPITLAGAEVRWHLTYEVT